MDRIMEWLIQCVIFCSRFSRLLSRAGVCRYEERRPGAPFRILLAGYNGARNTGADVRVISIARQLLSLYGEEAGADPAFCFRTDDPELGRHLYAALNRQKGAQRPLGTLFRQQAEKGRHTLQDMGYFLKNYLEIDPIDAKQVDDIRRKTE